MSSCVSCLFTNHCHKLLLFPEYVINCMYRVGRGIIETGRRTLLRRRVANSCRSNGSVWSFWAWVGFRLRGVFRFMEVLKILLGNTL